MLWALVTSPSLLAVAIAAGWVLDRRGRPRPYGVRLHDIMRPGYWRWAHARILLGVIVVAAGGQCGSGGKGGGVAECGVSYKVQIQEMGGQERIVGSAAAQCTKRPRSHNMTLWLEKKIGGKWTRQSPREFSNRLPHPNEVKKHVTALCVAGRWRTVVRTAGVISTGEPFDATFRDSERSVSRRDCGLD
ncbi:hypothetical protein [Bailinhaonella thermotolerans]|uniref:Uncharacterized protein n=1 Tax=Bailinhaonella thermotolerans TaxID=1070861 RepID=A0A3A3ZZE1_9ACTN|nr:hypothetical protein [Bailinhaonella thermotolerans]RJL19731.1 hypothetical protein D5H75_40100 [Bailinhaonella thermotolerans]